MAKYNVNAELYDNPLTEKEGDFTARPVIGTTLYNNDIASRIIEKRTEYRPETITNILDLADKEKAAAVAEGNSVVDGMGQYMLNIGGAFDAVTDLFDPARHSLGITYNPGKVVRGMLADTAVKAATVDVVGYSSPANGGTSFSNEVILTFTGDSGAVKQAIIAARDVGMQVLKTLEPSVELKSTTTPYIL